MTPAQERQLAELWAAREAAAERVRKTATDRVFGAQEQALREQIERQTAQIAANAKAIADLSGSVNALGERVRRGVEAGQAALRDDIAAMRAALEAARRDKK